MDRDPWSWTVQDVADFFRNEASAFIADMPNSRLPAMDAFLSVLAENDVSGSVLLTAIDASFLKEDCGLRSLGIRSTVMHCISKLKTRSTVYTQDPSQPQAQHTDAAAPLTPEPFMGPLPSAAVQPHPDPSATAEAPRSGEVEIEDARGRKRRKLELCSAAKPTSRHTKPPPPPVGFLGDAGFPVDDLFYGKTLLGQEVRFDIPDDIVVEAQDVNDDLADDNFQFYNVQKPPGEALYVQQQIRHLLQNDTVRPIRRRGREALAILPYREELLAGKKSQSATVFQLPVPRDSRDSVESDLDPIAVRESVAYLDADIDYAAQPKESSGEWDFMVHKYAVNENPDDGLPQYGQSDTGAASISSSLADLISQEEEERKTQQTMYLNEEEANEVMDNYLEARRQWWNDNRLPGLETRAWSTWKQTRGSKRIRDELILNAKEAIGKLTLRLNNHKRELISQCYKSERELEKVCPSMDYTIEDMELFKWKISVWQQRQEPHHTVRHGQGHASGSKATTSGPRQAFAIDPDDRLSVSPALGAAEEQFHPPRGSPSAPQHDDADDADHEGTDGDMSTSAQMAGFIEDYAVEVVDAPNSTSLQADGPAHETSTLVSSRPESSPPKTPTRPASSKQTEVIVISSSDESARSKPSKKRKWTEKQCDADPMSHTAAEVSSWDADVLIDRADRMRLLIKMLAVAGREMRDNIDKVLAQLRQPAFVKQLKAALLLLERDYSHHGGDQESDTMIFSAKLFLAWLCSQPDLAWSDKGLGIVWDKIDEIQPALFTQVLSRILRAKNTKLFLDPESAPPSSRKANAPSVQSLSSDSEELTNTPSKKPKGKKKKPQLSASARKSQAQASERRDRLAQAKAAHSQELAAIKQTDPSRSNIPVNLLKREDQEFIFVDEPIADKLKEHQQSGVQFMWNELTADGSAEGHGCILAHTMGLGKTMQAITVLVALNEAARSHDPRVYEQLPVSLRPLQVQQREREQLRIVVVCPATLIQNWAREIGEWAPEKLPNVFCIEASDKPRDQRDKAEQWHEDGGVLLIGYENLRSKVKKVVPLTDGPSSIGYENLRAEVKKVAALTDGDPASIAIAKLLMGAEVVVADEAHRLTNETSQTSKAVKLFKTESRLALTGTPMSNDVQEIYALVSWVHPDFLGPPEWFNKHFALPIKRGNYSDSDPSQKSTARKKLSMLHRRIEPKVDRASIEVLRGSLRSKTEFVITLPLTELQLSVYKKYVEVVLGDGKNENLPQEKMFTWLAALKLLTNHPLAFKRKLLASATPSREQHDPSEEPAPSTTSRSTGTDADEEDDLDEEHGADEAVRTLASNEQIVNGLTAEITDDISADLSAKMRILLDIIKLSREAGDKLLVFSQSIPTLDCVSQLLDSTMISHGRIDGKMPIEKRDKIIAEFDADATSVMLISTRAGGVGLNMQGANRVVLLDFGFNPTHEIQAIGRAFRLGQKKPVFVYRFVIGGTFEKNLYDTQMFKTGLFGKVVDKRNAKPTAAVNTKEYLYPPRDVPQEDLGEFVGKDVAIMDKILERQSKHPSMNNLIRKIELMETLQEEDHGEALTEQEQKEADVEFEKLGYGWGAGLNPARPRGRPANSTKGGPRAVHPSNTVLQDLSSAGLGPNGLPKAVPNGLPSFPSRHFQ